MFANVYGKYLDTYPAPSTTSLMQEQWTSAMSDDAQTTAEKNNPLILASLGQQDKQQHQD